MKRLQQMPDEPAQEYAKTALIMIVRCRYAAFTERFGREPGPHDPLFFDESVEHPVKADLPTTRRQLSEGALAAGVKLAPVLAYLGLNSLPDDNAGPARESLRAERHPEREIGPSRQRASDGSSVWTKFLADERLHRRHGITPEELQLVSGASFLGAITSVDDILLVLDMIRGRSNS